MKLLRQGKIIKWVVITMTSAVKGSGSPTNFVPSRIALIVTHIASHQMRNANLTYISRRSPTLPIHISLSKQVAFYGISKKPFPPSEKTPSASEKLQGT